MFPPTVALVPIATVPAVIVVVPVPLLIVTVLFPVEAMLTPDAPVSVKAPALVVRFEAAPASRLRPAPESIVIAPSASISILATLDSLLFDADIVIVFVSAALAVIVKLVVFVPSSDKAPVSILTALVASISTVCTFTSNVPVVVTSISLELPCINTPLAPSNVNVPALVVRFEAAPASRLSPRPESIVIAPSASISIFDILDASLFDVDIVMVFVSAALAVIVKLVVSVLSIDNVVPSTVIPALVLISSDVEFVVSD